MKINNKLYRVLTLAFLMFLCFSNLVMAQAKGLNIKATVVDKQANPISGVSVFGPSGSKASSSVNGNFEIELPDEESVILEKKGYISKIVNVFDLTGDIIMEKAPFLASEDDEIQMGVSTNNRRDMVGAFSKINTSDRLVYDNTQRVKDYINGLMLGVRNADNVRGIGTAIFVIDGVIKFVNKGMIYFAELIMAKFNTKARCKLIA